MWVLVGGEVGLVSVVLVYVVLSDLLGEVGKSLLGACWLLVSTLPLILALL